MVLHIDWKSDGITISNIGDRRLLRHGDGTFDISDGDTPNIRMAIRMLSIDTHETTPADSAIRRMEERFSELADWLASGPAEVSAELAEHLIPRLRRRNAVRIHREQGRAASLYFRYLAQTRMIRADGSVRQLFLRSSDEKIDGYNRLLAYAAPSYSKSERDRFREEANGSLEAELYARATFNLQLVEAGHAATFVIFPSLPQETDFRLFHRLATEAVAQRRGFWTDELTLLGYEFRMVEKLVKVHRNQAHEEEISATERNWISRSCCDVLTGALHPPQDYHLVAPQDRMFIWPKDVARAIARLQLEPTERYPT